ncbi:unnamed protein product, partial [Staurois parvus]
MYIHRHMYVHTHKHTCTHTDACTHIDVHTRRHMYTHVYTQRHMYMHTQPHTNTHMYMYTQTHPTHTARYCTLGGGREHSTHSFLCFHCAQLLSSLTAPSANDRSGLSSEPAQQDGPGGHTRPHHNFHSPLVSRRVEISSPGL